MLICESFPFPLPGFGPPAFSAYDVRRPGRPKVEKDGVTVSWSLTQDALERLLERLGADPEAAGREYEGLRARLVDFFDWKGAHRPEVAADETLDRAARRLEEGQAVQKIGAYVHGIAKLVLLEHLRIDVREQRAAAGAARELTAPCDPGAEARSACLARCLQALPEEGRELIVAYYEGEGRSHLQSRRDLARRLGITYATLKTRAHRLRLRLEACMRECPEAKGR
jgi:DNA-directed RNA polymerase specialized sigma24 family protein